MVNSSVKPVQVNFLKDRWWEFPRSFKSCPKCISWIIFPDINHGCYFDGSKRALTDLITCEDRREECHASCGIEHSYCESQSNMTIELCRSLCMNRNLRYYALEAGKQCFCGGALSDPFQYGSAAGASTNCSHPCSGNRNQTCGGEFKMQVYNWEPKFPPI